MSRERVLSLLLGQEGYLSGEAMSRELGVSRAAVWKTVDALRREAKASFCVIAQDEIVPKKYTTEYRSAIAFGRVRELEGEEKREALDRLEKQTQRGGCKIGGHPRYYQCDPRENPYRGMSEESLKQYSISPEQVRQALAPTAWDTLLFQLDDDDCDYPAGDIGDMDLYLGGFGSLNLLIRAEDLKNRDFSRVLAQWACT